MNRFTMFLLFGTIVMFVPIFMATKHLGVNRWKSIPVTILLTATGTAGTFAMFYIENAKFGGISFYGAVFLVPIVFLFLPPILKIPYSKLMDLSAIGECIMLAMMKIYCLTGGCCLGRVLLELSDGTVIRFPSRLVEMAAAIVLFVIFFRWAVRKEKNGELYIWYLILYGSSRFVLNFLREVWQTWNGTIPMGTIWSVCAVALGLVVLKISRKKQRVEIAKS